MSLLSQSTLSPGWFSIWDFHALNDRHVELMLLLLFLLILKIYDDPPQKKILPIFIKLQKTKCSEVGFF